MAILASFEERELNRLYTNTATGGPAYDTARVGNPRGIEQRHINRYDAIRTYEIEFGGLSQIEKLDLEEFFITQHGPAVGFRFYAPSDRNFLSDVIGIGTGSNDTFYLRRNYRSRSRFISRRIVKPVKGTLVITVDGTPVTPASINWDEGIVVLSSDPAAGAIVRCESGQYNVPVYFDVDAFTPVDYGVFANWESIRLQEILPTQLSSVGNDITPLSLAFTAPHSNDVFETTFDVTLTHTGCTKVYLYVGGVLHDSDTSAPFSFSSVPVAATTTGTFKVRALGVDASGNFVEAEIDLQTTPLPVGTIIEPDITEGGGEVGEIDDGDID